MQLPLFPHEIDGSVEGFAGDLDVSAKGAAHFLDEEESAGDGNGADEEHGDHRAIAGSEDTVGDVESREPEEEHSEKQRRHRAVGLLEHTPPVLHDLVGDAQFLGADHSLLGSANGEPAQLLEGEADVVQIECDESGMRIEQLDEVLALLDSEGRRPKFVYSVPTFQNPAGVTMSLERRRRLVELARLRGLLGA